MKNSIIDNPKKAVEKAKVMIMDWKKEHFIRLYLNSRSRLEKIELISLGTLNATLVHPRETFRPALVNSAVSVIVLHNHPSEDIEPSEDDIGLTERLKKAGEILGIDLADHIIFTEEKYYSFKENKII